MQSLEAIFEQSNQHDIHALARSIQGHVDAAWENSFQATHQQMVEKYPQIGDSVYAIYGKHLFEPIHRGLKQIGWRPSPRLPGSLPPSREWGPEMDRQRWMWSKISTQAGNSIGTIVCVYYHDHVEIRIARPPRIIALEVTTHSAVIRALCELSDDFNAAKDMNEEYEEYLRELEAQSQQPHTEP